jgi:hypothetical protein
MSWSSAAFHRQGRASRDGDFAGILALPPVNTAGLLTPMQCRFALPRDARCDTIVAGSGGHLRSQIMEQQVIGTQKTGRLTEPVWDAKYKDRTRVAPLRMALPFQTCETPEPPN